MNKYEKKIKELEAELEKLRDDLSIFIDETNSLTGKYLDLKHSGSMLINELEHAIEIEPDIKNNSYKLKAAIEKYKKAIE